MNTTYPEHENYLLNNHVKEGENIKFNCTSGLHTESYAVPENTTYKFEIKNIHSSNVNKGNIIKHLDAQSNKPIVNQFTGKKVILLDVNDNYVEDFSSPSFIL